MNDNEGQEKTLGAFKDKGGRRSYNCITIEDKQPLQENKRAQDMNGVGLKTQILFFFSTGIIEPQSQGINKPHSLGTIKYNSLGTIKDYY